MAGPLAISATLFGPLPHADVPHKLAGSTKLDGVAVRRRVEVRKRRTGEYVTSTVTQDDGAFEFRRLPVQTLAEPYIVTCFDDLTDSNALVFDYVYQVDDLGDIPTE